MAHIWWFSRKSSSKKNAFSVCHQRKMKTKWLYIYVCSETQSQALETNLWLPKRKVGRRDEGMRGTVDHRIDNQLGPTVAHRELYSVFCNDLY